MIILITGASHTGKTLLAQNILEKYHFPYLSLDILKMGRIRSKHTKRTVNDDIPNVISDSVFYNKLLILLNHEIRVVFVLL